MATKRRKVSSTGRPLSQKDYKEATPRTQKTRSEVGDLADKVAKGLKLDSGGPLLDMEELVYKATPAELESLRKQVLQKQTLSGFDDEGLVKRFVNATKPKEAENGSGDKSSFFNCFQNQIMLPTVLDSNDQLPGDLQKNWLCIVCPQGTRVLVIASHKSTRVYDLEGTWICEHDTHLPGGSPSPVSQVDDENECTILDCLYDNEQEIYYAVDLLCWKGLRYYKYEASVRLATLLEKLKDVPTLKGITQTNPFRFFSVPMTSSSQTTEVCKAIKRASFELTGLLFYHKKALYLPGLTPLGAWVETTYIPSILDIQVHKLQFDGDQKPHAKRDWRKNRYEMIPEAVTPVYNSAYVTATESHTNAQRNRGPRGGHNRHFEQGGGRLFPQPNFPFRQPLCPPFPDYSSGYMNLSGYQGFGFDGFGHNCGNFSQQQQQQRFGHPHFKQNQASRDNRKGNQKEKVVKNENVLAKEKKVGEEAKGKKVAKEEAVEKGKVVGEEAKETEAGQEKLVRNESAEAVRTTEREVNRKVDLLKEEESYQQPAEREKERNKEKVVEREKTVNEKAPATAGVEGNKEEEVEEEKKTDKNAAAEEDTNEDMCTTCEKTEQAVGNETASAKAKKKRQLAKNKKRR